CIGVAAVVAQSPTPTPLAKANARPTSSPTNVSEPYDHATVATMASKCVVLSTESGDIEMELFPESAPETVRNFLNLVAIGAYDTTTFSRVVPGFVDQGGNIWTRSGGLSMELATRARRTIRDEPSKILHERGIVSMARPDTPNAATTNFFILVDRAPNLDGTFAAFGRVTHGMDVVDAINKAPVIGEKPDKPVRLKMAKITACTPAN
ncbi:MAG TPA: peptidylprolyl isomerase, partial [Pyrinomonadaceae bacterium]